MTKAIMSAIGLREGYRMNQDSVEQAVYDAVERVATLIRSARRWAAEHMRQLANIVDGD
jgi:hypothetical protein